MGLRSYDEEMPAASLLADGHFQNSNSTSERGGIRWAEQGCHHLPPTSLPWDADISDDYYRPGHHVHVYRKLPKSPRDSDPTDRQARIKVNPKVHQTIIIYINRPLSSESTYDG